MWLSFCLREVAFLFNAGVLGLGVSSFYTSTLVCGRMHRHTHKMPDTPDHCFVEFSFPKLPRRGRSLNLRNPQIDSLLAC